MTQTHLSRIRLAGAYALALFTLGGCSNLSQLGTSVSTLGGALTPYKMDIVQGNVVTREQVQVLQPGMPREQVRSILGTPLLASVFHAQRWDYVFTFKRQGQEPQQRRVTVFFKGDVLERVDAEALPSEVEFVASLDTKPMQAEAPLLQATDAQLQAFAKDNPKPASPAVAPTPAPLPASYPPLESR